MNLRLDHLPAPDTVTRECMPVLQDPQGFAQDLARIQDGLGTDGAGGARPVRLYLIMLVTRDGDVAYATLKRPSTSRDLDRQVLQLGRRLRFRPAMLENVPVDVWVEQPLDLTMPF